MPFTSLRTRAASLSTATLAGVLATAGVLAPTAASAAPDLPSGCVRGEARQVTCTYATPGDVTFTVPGGVTHISATASGGSGGSGGRAAILSSAGGAGGAGAVVTAAQIAVTPGTQVQIVVGSAGADGQRGRDDTAAAEPGGAGGRGYGSGGDGGPNNKGTFSAGGSGGGGGGGSAVLPSGQGAVLVAAGGAGGGGGLGGLVADGGSGGDAGESGGAGSQATGGLAGGADGPTGQPAPTPSGGSAGSGGGGGGNPGGGAVAATGSPSSGSGGGGGISTGDTVTGTNTGNGSVVITYTEPLTAGAITTTSGNAQTTAAGTAFPQPLVATVSDAGTSEPVPGAPVTFTVTAGSATFSTGAAATVTSGADGRATSPTLTAGSSPGQVTVLASTPGVSTSATFTLTITAPPNQPPTANADGYTTAAGAPALIVTAPGVLGNDTDPDTGDTLTAVLVTGPSNGTLTLSADGSFTYSPRSGFTGTDTFTYQAVDKAGARSTPATVTITVNRANADLAITVTAPNTTARGGSFPVTVTVVNNGPSTANLLATGLTVSRGLTVTNGGGGAVSRDKQSVGFLAGTLRPGATVTYTVTVTADRSTGTRTISAGTVSTVRDNTLGNNVSQRSVRIS